MRNLKVLHCPCCQKVLPRKPGKRYYDLYICSEECRQKRRERRRKPRPEKVKLEEIPCAECGNKFLPASRRGKVCSEKCSRRYHAKLADQRHRERQKDARFWFTPEKRPCPGCGIEVANSFDSPNKRYCSRRCNKNCRKRKDAQRRIAEDPGFLVKLRLSARIREVLARNRHTKCFSTLRYMGCTSTHLREHLESQFTEGMTWDNYGVFGWHVDHVIPCAAFDLSRVDNQMVCFNYRNLRPLWRDENIVKSHYVDLDTLLEADLWVVQEARKLGVRV